MTQFVEQYVRVAQAAVWAGAQNVLIMSPTVFPEPKNANQTELLAEIGAGK